jgi:hypothetical protein
LAECWAHFPFILIIAWLFYILQRRAAGEGLAVDYGASGTNWSDAARTQICIYKLAA